MLFNNTVCRDMRTLSESERQRSLSLEEQPFRRAKRERNFLRLMCLLSNRKPYTKVKIDVDLEDYYRIKDSKKNQD